MYGVHTANVEASNRNWLKTRIRARDPVHVTRHAHRLGADSSFETKGHQSAPSFAGRPASIALLGPVRGVRESWCTGIFKKELGEWLYGCGS